MYIFTSTLNMIMSVFLHACKRVLRGTACLFFFFFRYTLSTFLPVVSVARYFRLFLQTTRGRVTKVKARIKLSHSTSFHCNKC